ncbi:hypothetical protein B566_EDAN010094 [Ephemera danica]|nr:hypothetical protein B566_EDAN010094 [Ephemera danica]
MASAPAYPDLSHGGVVVHQPGHHGLQMQPLTMRANNTPPGLEYLTMVDQLLVHQKMEVVEALLDFETQNRYTIKNSMGQEVYNAKEDTGCLNRICCGTLRSFDIKILDNSKNEVIHLYRPLRCQSCFFPCCLQNMEISSPPGNVIGRVEQEWSLLTPKYRILDAAGNIVFRMKGPICHCSCCGRDVNFKVTTADGKTEIGKISKQWTGLLREAFTDSDYFGINFPMDLDVKMKAVLLGALFLIVTTADGKTEIGKISKQWTGLLREAFTDSDYFGINFPMDLDVKMKAVLLGALFLIDYMYFEKK